MFASFPASAASVTKSTIDVYAETVAEYSLEAVALACARYRSGEVPDQDRAYAPSSGALAQQCRLFRDALAYRDREVAERAHIIVYPIGAIPPPPAVPLGPIEVDFGDGMIDMRDMAPAEKDKILEARGRAVESKAVPGWARPQIKRMED